LGLSNEENELRGLSVHWGGILLEGMGFISKIGEKMRQGLGDVEIPKEL